MENDETNGRANVISAKTPRNRSADKPAAGRAASDKVAAKEVAAKAAATPQAAQAPQGSGGADRVKVLPPQTPVDVPNQPAKPTSSTPDEAARDTRRQVDDETESNWADGAAPQPRAKNARSSIL